MLAQRLFCKIFYIEFYENPQAGEQLTLGRRWTDVVTTLGCFVRL
jgi:hypothetical protein